MMDCAEFRELWSDAYDGRVSARHSDDFGRHLDACADCRRQHEAYVHDLDHLGRYLRRVAGAPVASQRWAPPPAPSPIAARAWLVTAASGAAAACLWLSVNADLNALRPAVDSTTMSLTSQLECPWRDAAPNEVEHSVSYPLLAVACLDAEFELVHASVRREEPCPEAVRLTYEATGRQLVLEQHRETDLPCCNGDHILLGEVVGCVEDQGTSLRWQQNRQEFRLSGDAALGEVVRIAGNLSESFSALE